MKYWFDAEFIEYPCTIDLISIGMVSEDGRELYCISNEFDESKANDWVKEKILSKLPPPDNQVWMSRLNICRRIVMFIGKDNPEFWAYYADYDWVVFCWLFGSMIDLPKGWPMYCCDIKQWCDDLGNPKLPRQLKGEHNALEDAKWNKLAWDFLNNRK